MSRLALAGCVAGMLSLVVPGCGTATTAEVTCAHASDCATDATCIGGTCIPSVSCVSSRTCPDLVCSTSLGVCVECNSRADCPPDQPCVAGVCEAAAAPCVSDRECSAMGLVCSATRMVCVECRTDVDCADGTTCGADGVCGSHPIDAGGLDASMSDAGGRDAGGHDTGAGDAGGGEAGPRDAGLPDVAMPRPDAGEPPDAFLCPPTSMVCSGRCVDVTSNPAFCGGCDVDCGPGGACFGGMCQCGVGLVLCGAECADLTSSAEHCGTCGIPCGVGMACHGSMCVPTSSFHVVSLDATACSTVDHEAATGDDRGGIAIGTDQLFVTGDTATARMSAADLSGAVTTGVLHEAIVGDVDSEHVYVLLGPGDTEVTIATGNVMVTELGSLAPDTGALTVFRLPLSRPITVSSDTAIMAGAGEMLLGVPSPTEVDVTWWQIDLVNGAVTQLGQTPMPAHAGCETWAYWGIAEHHHGAHYAVFVQSPTTIARLFIPETGMSTLPATPVAAFTSLGDMCSITFSTSRSRWYFHHEYMSQFTGTTMANETAGFCSGAFDRP